MPEPEPHTEDLCKVAAAALSMSSPNRTGSMDDALRHEVKDALGPYAQFMVERCLKTVSLFGENFSAFTETEKAISGDDWIWTDDNAKMLELLVLPGIYESMAPVANRIIQFILRMTKSDFMLRRAAGPTTDANMEGFKVEENGCTHLRFHNGLMNFNGNPSFLNQSYRFHDGRDLDVVAHTAPQLHLRVLGTSKETVFDIGRGHDGCLFRAVEGKGKIEAGYTGALEIDGRVIAHYEFIHTFGSANTATDHRLTVTPANGAPNFTTRVAFAVVVLPNDKLNVRLQRLLAFRDGLVEEADVRYADVGRKVDAFVGGRGHKPPPQWIAAVMPGNAGFAYSSFRFISSQRHFQKTSFEPRQNGYLWWKKLEIASVVNHYECPPGEPCVVHERHLMTAGGLYDNMYRYAQLFERVSRGEDEGMIDYSISYDIGAELNGLASFYLFASKGAYSSNEGFIDQNLTEVRAAIDHHLEIYWKVFAHRDTSGLVPNLFLRGLAFATIAVNSMFAATGDAGYLQQLEAAMDLMMSPVATGLLLRNYIFKLPVEDFVYRCVGDQEWTAVDCQASAHLLFGRLLATFPFGASLSPHLQRCSIAAAAVKTGGPMYVYQRQEWGPQYTLKHHTEASFTWGFQGGLLSRGINAVRVGLARFATQCPLPPSLIDSSLSQLESMIYNYTLRSTTLHENGRLREIRTSIFSAETNTESQPWISMGLHGSVVERVYEAVQRKEGSAVANCEAVGTWSTVHIVCVLLSVVLVVFVVIKVKARLAIKALRSD